MEKFYQLQPAAKQPIHVLIEQEAAAADQQAAFDYDGWFNNVETLRNQIRANQGNKLPPVDVVGRNAT